MHILRNTEVLEALVPLAGRRVVDVGSGDGHLTRRMAQLGAHVTGVEVQLAQLHKARSAPRVSDEAYVEAGAESLPFPDASVDVVVFFNSLHHVPAPLMPRALSEAARVLTDGGLLYVSEPVATGAFFELCRPVDDETTVRAQAQEALRTAASLGFTPVTERLFGHPMTIASSEALAARLLGADGRRAAVLASHAEQLRRDLERLGTKTPEGFRFEQPTHAILLARRRA